MPSASSQTLGDPRQSHAPPVLHRQGRRRQDLARLRDGARARRRGADGAAGQHRPASNLDEMLGVAARQSADADPGRAEPVRHEHRSRGRGRGLPGARPRTSWRPTPATSERRDGARAALRRLHHRDRRLRRVRRPARRGRRAATTTSSSTPPRPATRCACSACRRRGRASSRATTAAPRALARIPASRCRRRASARARRRSAIRRGPPSSSSRGRTRAPCARRRGPAGELPALGLSNQHLVVNGVFRATDRGRSRSPAPSSALGEQRSRQPAAEPCRRCRRTEVPLRAFDMVGLDGPARAARATAPRLPRRCRRRRRPSRAAARARPTGRRTRRSRARA